MHMKKSGANAEKSVSSDSVRILLLIDMILLWRDSGHGVISWLEKHVWVCTYVLVVQVWKEKSVGTIHSIGKLS